MEAAAQKVAVVLTQGHETPVCHPPRIFKLRFLSPLSCFDIETVDNNSRKGEEIIAAHLGVKAIRRNSGA
jgi:hypothetical protein